MAWQPPKGMDEYLKATELCDCNNVELQRTAKEIVKDTQTPKEAALKIFYCVRDQIKFGMDYADVKASQTLKKGLGYCFTKPNLQIALLRAVRIPARCHYVHLPKELLKDMAPGFAYRRMPAAIGHAWCECYLSAKWIACEALFDEPFYEARLRTGSLTKEKTPTIDWDGETDLILPKLSVAKDVGTFPSLDDLLKEAGKGGEGTPPRRGFFGWFVCFLANRRLNKIRKGS